MLASRWEWIKTWKNADGMNTDFPPSGNLKDTAEIRKDFPPLKNWAYMDAAYTGLVPRQVISASAALLMAAMADSAS